MDKRALAEQLLGLPPGALLDFKDYGDHVAMILPDGRKLTLGQAQLDALALSGAAPQASQHPPEASGEDIPGLKPPASPPARASRSRRPRRSFSNASPSRTGSDE